MAIPPGEKNKKLKASVSGEPMAAEVVLKQLRARGKAASIISSVSGPQLPIGGIEEHLQGIAIRKDGRGRPHAYLTTNAEGGKIIVARNEPDGKNYIVEEEPVGFNKKDIHPGGIQIIGHFLVVPIFNDEYSGIEIRDLNDGLSVIKEFRIDRRAYSVGIATTSDNRGEFYVMAVVTHSEARRVNIYRTPSNLKLSHPSCFFELKCIYKPGSKVKDLKKNWNNYSNGISLLSDENNNLYFLGFFKTTLLPGGKDFADLYHLDLTQPEDKLFKRLSRFHAKCNDGPAFRWGASAFVLGDDNLEIYACEKNVQKKTTIRKDMFSK
ncbi:MAG: hypothetical protein KAJ31_03885 [Deltaproteobacteria bacterium]|nr:hypothetical protein [Deltaproteobacteria bacterium]MCK5710912.1 hypothetical protein [Deltaproteobacteria bacterium]